MTRIITLLFIFVGSFRGMCDDHVTVSPQHTFEVVQTYKDKDGLSDFTETLHFFSNKEKDVELEDNISWAALIYISPDDRWILRIQKSGSGDNFAYLYKIGTNQSVWRLERNIVSHALDLLSHRSGGLPPDLYHTGIEFGSWDLKAGLLHFTVHGSGGNGTRIYEALVYNLSDDSIAPDLHPPKTQ